MNVELLDSHVFGEGESGNEGFILSFIVRLTLTEDMGIKKLDICSDSQLVVNQLLGTYQARDSKMASYLAHVKTLQFTFEEFNIA